MSENTKIQWCECKCGCGAKLESRDNYGRRRQFVSGHNPKGGTFGRTEGQLKQVAARCGLTVEEWKRKRAMGSRRCFRCKTWKPKFLFSKDKTRKEGLSSICKSCSSDAATASRYNMTHEALREFRKQRSVCEICGRNGLLYVDHHHVTGIVRGILCPRCNSAIGLLKEDRGLFESAIRYLEAHNGTN